MNRQNFYGHLALAAAVIILAAFVGQMRRMESRHERFERREVVVTTHDSDHDSDEAGDFDGEAEDDAEVIVRFRSGTSRERINRITEGLNDRLLDRFEFINNEAVIADEDGLSP